MLTNDMKVDLINLKDQSLVMNCEALSKEQYDLIQTKDPKKMYFVNDNDEFKVYLGDFLINIYKPKSKYFLAPAIDNNEYVIYMNIGIHSDLLIEIARFNNAQSAINALNKYNNIGSHNNEIVQISEIFESYIQGDISLHELFIGIIKLSKWENNVFLQDLLHYTTSYGIMDYKNRNNLPNLLKDKLYEMKENANPLFKIYANLYDLTSENKFFIDLKYKRNTKDIDLSKIINEVVTIIKS
jgi:hypothetical protein